ncbi:MAG: glycosyltransferase [Lachnospiraceae bacterium]|nr:glycosyltransferase [Candidatus Colinaster scatohippi]
MVYAPILITTLNRYEHLKRCITSLQNNDWAKYTELYIGVDYPPAEKYVEGYKKIREYLEAGIDGFAEVHIYFHETNLGPIPNYDFLRKITDEKYDRFIFSEDDNEFAPSFIEYMDKALDKYADDEDIISIYGWHPGIKGEIEEGTAAFKVKDFSAYGYGTWVEKYENMLSNLNRQYIEKICDSNEALKKIKSYNPGVLLACTSALLRKERLYCTPDGSIPTIDMMYMLYFIMEDKYMLCSTRSLVKNWGYDGTGVNCNSGSDQMARRELSSIREYDLTLEDNPKEYSFYRVIDKKTEIKRKVQVIGAYIKIYIWRKLANRKSFK